MVSDEKLCPFIVDLADDKQEDDQINNNTKVQPQRRKSITQKIKKRASFFGE